MSEYASLFEDKGGVPALKLAKDLGMHYSTVWHMVHKIRDAMRARDQRITLAGFIELGEAIIGPQARKPGRPSKTEAATQPRKKHSGASLRMASREKPKAKLS